MPTHLIQLRRGNNRRVAIVEEPGLRLIGGAVSIYELANLAVEKQLKLDDTARQHATGEVLEYDAIYAGRSEWRILPAIDHPLEPARCLVSGTGLTHLGSARGRQAMHATSSEPLTYSMKMFGWGVEGGRPRNGEIGTSPEWFYKSNGTSLRAHGEPLEIPPFALDGGEEAELAGIYLISDAGIPYRIGMATGNEFSDHRFEKTNYLYLASSKLRSCAIGPELVLDPDFSSVTARIAVERDERTLWSRTFDSGEAHMCHSLQNIEHHHFKFPAHRRPGDVHVHFFGTDCLSYSDGICLQEGDVMQMAFDGFGRPLRNPLHIDRTPQELIRVRML
ncbi:MAG TPA: AraD1 family protein [Terriglobales bacterium]|nr:AraD1 family protein [Terriglobales bacterium]